MRFLSIGGLFGLAALAIALVMGAGLAGCGVDEEVNGNGNGAENGNGNGTENGNGNGEQTLVTLGETGHGTCGESIGLGDAAKQDDRGDWCEAERLTWVYDDDSAVLTLLHSRVELNCCTEHSITYEQVGDIHVVTEMDRAPRDGRCRCTCLFDFRSSLEGIEPGMVSILLLLDVEESDEVVVVWEGDIDLDEGSGVIVIDDEESMFCDVFGP